MIETICYYDSWKCLRTQKNLSPYFCFKYLYDNNTDSMDSWTDYNEVEDYLLKLNYTIEQIHEEFKKAIDDYQGRERRFGRTCPVRVANDFNEGN